MLQIKGPSDKPCFICESTQETRAVKFEDKTFSGVLCMACISVKTNGKPPKPGKEPKAERS